MTLDDTERVEVETLSLLSGVVNVCFPCAGESEAVRIRRIGHYARSKIGCICGPGYPKTYQEVEDSGVYGTIVSDSYQGMMSKHVHRRTTVGTTRTVERIGKKDYRKCQPNTGRRRLIF